MAKITDLYPLLKAYAAKITSPYIEIGVFLEFLQKYAGRKVQDNPEWGKWLTNPGIQFWSELSGLVENDTCVLMEDETGGHLYLPFYYIDKINDIYNDPDNEADLPFPTEESLNFTIPENQLAIISLGDLNLFFDEFRKKNKDDASENWGPNQIVKMLFPDNLGSVLLLAGMIPRKLLESAMLKVRHYIRIRGNKEFVLHKLSPQFQGNEKYLQEMLDQLMMRPIDCLTSLEKSDDFAYIFWTYFCSLIKIDINKRNDALSEDIAAVQAANIIELCNGFYKTISTKKREREIAFRNLEINMGRIPCHYRKDEILKFCTDKGLPLLGMYSLQELDEYIKRKTTQTNKDELPEWFLLRGDNSRQWYVRKDKYLFLCVKMLLDTRPAVEKAIAKRWTKLLKEFRKDSTMEKDADFEKMLGTYTAEFNYLLTVLLADQRLPWVYEETERLHGPISPSLRIFKSGALLPLSALYALHRKNMLNDVKIRLPFWYSTPVLTAILGFFKKLFKRKVRRYNTQSPEPEKSDDGKQSDLKEIQNIAEAVQSELVPAHISLETYLDELELKWNRLIDVKFRENLVIDTQSLVRDHLRKMLRVHKSKKISREGIESAATLIISGTPALHQLSSLDALHLYIQLYMVKLLLDIRPEQLVSKFKQ